MVKATRASVATATIPQEPPMSPKKRGRKPAMGPRRGEHVEEAPINPYLLLRMRKCMRNNAYMQKLGIPVLAQLCANTTISPEKQQQQDKEDSGSEYNGEDEDDSDAHQSDDDQEPATLSSKKKTTTKKRKRGAEKKQPGMQSSIVTRGMKNHPADVNAMTNQAEIPNQATEEADVGDQNGCLAGDEDACTELNLDGHTPNGATMNDVNENGQTQVANVAEDDLFDEDRTRGPSIGRELVQMTRSRKKRLPLVIEPGKRRPNSPMIAAKFATECNIAVRSIVPIFPHWKDYKKCPKLIDAYIKRVATKFCTDDKSVPFKKACVAMMKKAVRQQRYKLKSRYFDALPLHQVPKTSPVPETMTNEQWDKLVEYWKIEKKMVTCEKNRENRSKVQYHQSTGSRSYEMHVVHLADKYKDEPPNALELWKETHYSKKKGFSPQAQSLIAEIEEKLNEPVDDGLQPKDVTDVVSHVLAQKTKKNMFLVNVGLQSNATRVSAARDLEEELVVEKQTSSDLREVVKAQQQQIEEMMKKFQEAETARAKQEEERAKQEEESKKRQADIDALIKNLMSMVPGCQATQ